ncbi:hypothetical protein GCM10022395_06410 [Snuella lapsa]|uniref:Uncharacterized protein n=1 Tax=Snuella lapsa TaxID=870481 RepID=A0ABP6WXD2_9FLAO
MRLLQQGGYIIQGNEQGNAYVNGYDQSKVPKVQALVLFQQENDHERPNGGQCGGQYGQKRFFIPFVTDMVYHDDAVIYNDPKGNGNSGKGIELQLYIQGIIKDNGYEQVGNNTQKQYGQVLKAPVYQDDQDQQDKKGKQGALLYLLKFLYNEFRRVLGHF